jgi:hypothetical protein
MAFIEVHTASTDHRIATIYRAIQHMERYGPQSALVACTLHYTDAHQYLKDDPHTLIRKLHEAVENYHLFGAWKVAQQYCIAAGIETSQEG